MSDSLAETLLEIVLSKSYEMTLEELREEIRRILSILREERHEKIMIELGLVS